MKQQLRSFLFPFFVLVLSVFVNSIYAQTTSAPTITSLSPTSGPVGTSVTITGTDLGWTTSVTFNETAATSFTVNSATQITATVPPAGTGNVVVTTPGGNSPGVSFTVVGPYITSLSSSSGNIGSRIAINGGNFSDFSLVTVNNVNAFVFSEISSTTRLLVAIPSGAVSGANQIIVKDHNLISNSVTFTVPSPVITSISPSSGPVGTSTTITGINFGAGSTVTIGGVIAAITSSSPTKIIATLPNSLNTGANAVIVTNNSLASNSIDFTVIPPPTITSLSPSSGPVGSHVTITGTDFTDVTAVTFNGIAATAYTVNSATQITATVPMGATTGNVVVTTPDGTSNSKPFYVSYPPTITSISPSSGPIGRAIIMTGMNFTGATGVTFNGTAATSFTVNSATQITATVPAGATTGYVVVTNVDGTSNSFYFTVIAVPPAITSLSPSSGPVGSHVTITGTDFTDVTAVTFNGIAATAYTVNSITKITATVPAGATTGDVVVNTPGGASNGAYFSVRPAITNLSPYACVVGSPVTITGTNFTGATGVKFDYTAATSFTVNSGTQITAIVPAGATRGDVVVTTPDGTSNSWYFEAVDVPTISHISPDQFAHALGQAGSPVIITGTNFTRIYEVSFNGLTAKIDRFSATEIRAIIPAGFSSGNVVVMNVNGLAASKSNGVYFEVIPDIPSLSPNSGAVGTPVTITGTDFTRAYFVRFNGLEADFVVHSGTEITATVPAGARSGNVVVEYVDGTDLWSSNGVYFSVLPGITSLSPTNGVVGSVVTITGTDFTNATGVSFNGTAATSFTVNSGTQITATVPVGATTGAVVVTTAAGTSSGVSFTVSNPTLGAPSVTNVACFGGTTGSIAITASGGVEPYTYTLSGSGTGSNTSGTFTGLPAGTYAISVSDGNNGTANMPNITVGQPAGALTLALSAGSSQCADGTTTLIATASGGTSTYTYGLTPGNESNSTGLFTINANTAYTVTATDSKGCIATGDITVTATDNVNPTITAPAAVAVNTNTACTATGVALGTPVTADNCTGVSVTNNAPAAFPLGATTVTWTVRDAAGNRATATQVVTVTDNTAPVAPTLSAATGECSVTVQAPTATDNCAGIVTGTTTDPLTYNRQGTFTIHWTFSDGNGNSSTANQTVTVSDNIKPTITAPGPVAVNSRDACTATGVVLGTPTTADNCSVISVTNNAPPVFPLGNTTVTWTVTDGNGNTATATQVVMVTSNVSPTGITAQPRSQAVKQTESVSFSVIATGTNLTYQWYVNGTAPANEIRRETSATLILKSARVSDAGTYYVRVTGTCGSVLSTGATLTVSRKNGRLAAIEADEPILQLAVEASPNPTTGLLKLNVTGAGRQPSVKVRLYNLLQHVAGEWTMDIEKGRGEATIDIRKANEGIYFLSVEGDQSRAVRRVLKVNQNE